MRVLFLTLLAVLVMAPLARAANFGSSLGYMATARATGKGPTTIGGTVGFADNTTFVAGINYGITDKADGRIRVGLADYDGFDTAAMMASVHGPVRPVKQHGSRVTARLAPTGARSP